MKRKTKYLILCGLIHLTLAGLLLAGCSTGDFNTPSLDWPVTPADDSSEPPADFPESPSDDSSLPGDTPEESPVSLPPVSFEIGEWEVINEIDPQYDSPRAYLAVHFSTDTDVSLTLNDPAERETCLQLVTQKVTEVKLPMTPSSMETPKSGTYLLTVNRWSGEPVTTLEVGDFGGADLSIEDVRFVGRGDIVTDTLRVEVVNHGDLPAYVENARIQIGGVRVSSSGEPNVVILPDETDILYYEWYYGGGILDVPTVALELRDSGGDVVAAYSGNITLASWEHHIDWELGYNVRYPSTWTMTDKSSPVEVLITIENPIDEVQITIRSYPAAGAQLKQWADERVSSILDGWFSSKILKDKEITWDGLPARRIVWEGREVIEDDTLRGIEVCFKEGDRIYSVRAIVAQPFYSECGDRVDAIIDSFELMK